MQPGDVGHFQDLYRLEGLQVDAGDARRVVAVDEEPASVELAVGLRQLNVVRVIPGYEAERSVEEQLGLLAVIVTVFRVLGKNGNFAEQSAGRQPVNGDLTTAARRNAIT